MYRILIVDDEEIIIQTLGEYIREHFDLEVYKAYSAIEAREMLRLRRFDVIITDVSMPVMNGLELLDLAKTCWPQCYVIILTAYNSFQYVHHAIQYERVEYLLKADGFPVIHEKLQACLQKLDEERRQELLFEKMRSKLASMTPYLRNDVLDRLLLPRSLPVSEEELESAELPLRLNEPFMLAVGRLDDLHRLEMSRRIHRCSDYIEKRMAERGMLSVLHIRNYCAVWLFQRSPGHCAAQTDETLIILAQDVLSQVTEVNARDDAGLSAVLCDHFLALRELPAAYNQCMLLAEALSGAPGLLLSGQRDAPQMGEDFPSFEDLESLGSLIRLGRREDCLRFLANGLEPVRAIDDMRLSRPMGTVSALTYLLHRTAQEWGVPVDAAQDSAVADPRSTGEAWVQHVLHAMNYLFDSRSEQQQDNLSWLVGRIDEYIQEHFREDISLTSLSEYLHYSTGYLSRIYKNQADRNFITRLTEIRLAHAEKLLLTTADKVGDIARESGFCSTKYFNQAFKKWKGCTASQYRNQHGNPV